MSNTAYRTPAVPCSEAIHVPPPPPPSTISIFAYGVTVSIEDAFTSQLATADVSHGAGMLARNAFEPARPMLQGAMLDVVTTIADRLHVIEP